VNDVESQGTILPVGVTSEKEMTDIDFSGDLAFNDLIYILSNCLCLADVAQDAAHATVFYWTFKPKAKNADTFQTYGAIQGQDAGASSAPGVHFSSLDFEFSEKKAGVSGKGFGQVYNHAATEPADPVIVPLIPITPANMDVFVASTYAGIAAGQISDCEGAKLSFPDRKTPIKTRDSRKPSYSSIVQKRIVPTAQIVVDKNTSSAGYLTSLRAKTTNFCRIQYLGPQIGSTGVTYGVDFDYAFKFKKMSPSGQNDQFVSTFDMGLTLDNTAFDGAWCAITITTDMSPTVAGINTLLGALGAGTVPTVANAAAAEAAGDLG